MLLIELGIACIIISLALFASLIFLTDIKWNKISNLFSLLSLPIFVIGIVLIIIGATILT